MVAGLYRIVFRGELAEGVEREEAETNLRARFKYSDSALERIFSKKALVLKGGLEKNTAFKYQQALAQAGLVCELQMAGDEASARQTTQENMQENAHLKPDENGPRGLGNSTHEVLTSDPPDTETSSPVDEDEAQAEGPLTDVIVQSLRQTKPWVRLISVLLFFAAGLGLFGTVVPLMTGLHGFPGGPPYLFIFGVQALFSLLYLIPAFLLFKYASAIRTLLEGGGVPELETALVYQKSFWRFSGILALLGLLICLIGVSIAILVPVVMGVG